MKISEIGKIYPNALPNIVNVLESELNKVDWHDENKIHFLAQCAHESGGFRLIKENLNYSAQGLMKTFPKYFKFSYVDPIAYAYKPDKIADIVYANRMGNGDVNSHDGSRYKGRGLIQITGKNNYTKCLQYLGKTDPEYLETIEGAVKSAIWFWTYMQLFKETDIKKITKYVNGGLNGLEDRIKQYNRIRKLLLNLQ